MVRDRRPPVRRGVTLTEVLVAMFVMAIGMISLLTLFPLGAMQVGQALRDDRATQLARQADAFIRQLWRTEVLPNSGNVEGFFWAMEDPYLVVRYPNTAVNGTGSVMRFVGQDISPKPAILSWYDSAALTSVGTPNFGAAAGSLPTSYTLTKDRVSTVAPAPTTNGKELYVQPTGTPVDGPGYPVLLDPAFLNAIPSSISERAWAGVRTPTGFAAHPNTLRIPRRTCQIVNPVNAPYTATVSAFELTTLVDDMSVLANGAPSGTELGRQGRYSWAAVVQRPRNEDRTIADLSILVFDKRPALPQAGDELVIAPDNNPVPNAMPTPPNDYLAGTRTVRITLPNRTNDTSPVLLRRGGWIIDGTIDSNAPTVSSARRFVPYRVSGFTEFAVNATTTTYDVDLETPLKSDLTAASQLYLFAGLIEVFTRPHLRPDAGY